jgi:hypothetical protein
MKFARWVFLIAGIYGILVLSPMYFLADKFGEQDPPVITHREYYYGFIGVGIAFQVLFLLIAREPLRLRPAIIAAILEKLSFGVAVLILYSRGEAPLGPTASGIFDLVLGALFAIAYVRLGHEESRNTL